MNTWVSYTNGNYKVLLNTVSGTKIRSTNDSEFRASTVESIDIKISDRCNIGCSCCHENSTPNGDLADLTFEGTFLEHMHPYTELAVGGGNVLEHQGFEQFLLDCKKHQYIPSVTINQQHFMESYDFIKRLCDEKLIYGLGVSLTNPSADFIERAKSIPTVVVHTIAGLTTEADYEALRDKGLKVLILGYKKFRRGETLYDRIHSSIDNKINSLKNRLKEIIDNKWFEVISFDNLALNHLNLKDIMDKNEWERFYMGDDGVDGEMTSATMYVDLVKRKFAKNSCSSERFDLLPTIENMYDYLRDNCTDKK